MRIKNVGVPNKEEVKNKIITYCLEAIYDNLKFCRRLKHGGNLKWKNGSWNIKSTILHPVDIIIYYSGTDYIPNIKRPIHSEYSKCKIAAHVLGVHYEWVAGFNTGFWGISSSILSVFKRKTNIGQQARDGKEIGYNLHSILLSEFFKINKKEYDEHDWEFVTNNCQKCKLCEVIGLKKENSYFVNSNLNCGAGCAKIII